MRLVAHIPDQVNLKVEFEIEDDGTELEIELTW
jgi:amphi-Trp domain-containing protein